MGKHTGYGIGLGSGGSPRVSCFGRPTLIEQRRLDRAEWDAAAFNADRLGKLTDWDSFYGPVEEPLEGFDALFNALGDRR